MKKRLTGKRRSAFGDSDTEPGDEPDARLKKRRLQQNKKVDDQHAEDEREAEGEDTESASESSESSSDSSSSSSDSSESSDSESSDDDEGENEGKEKEDAGGKEREDAGEKVKRGVANSLLRGIDQNRLADWILHACLLARYQPLFLERGRLSVAELPFVEKSWEWLREVGLKLPQSIMYDMLASSLTLFGPSAAFSILKVLQFPAFLNGQFIIRLLWNGLNVGVCASLATNLRRFIVLIAGSEEARKFYGPRHVLIRLMSRATTEEPFEVVEIEELNSLILFRRLRSVEDVNDLLQLGWRPNAGTLLDLAQTEPLCKSIHLLAPAVWVDLSSTLPMWLDSPYNPSTALATNMETAADFWDVVPEYWLESENQIRAHCATLSQPRPYKMALMKPSNLQRMLTLMHKAPTLLRYAWVKKSLTWLNYIKMFRHEHFHTMLQVLLQPPLARPPCLCHVYRLSSININRKNRRRRHAHLDVHNNNDANVGPRGHNGCEAVEVVSHVMNPLNQQCMPWYRTSPQTPHDPDRFDIINEVLHQNNDQAMAPYSLNRRGKTIAIAQLLLLLTAKGITATSIHLLAEIVASWNVAPTIKDLRLVLGKMNEFATTLTNEMASRPCDQKKMDMSNGGTPGDRKHGGGGGDGARTEKAAAKSDIKAAEGCVIGSLGMASSVQSHVLYKSPKDAVLCSALRTLHAQLNAATSKRDWDKRPLQDQKLQNLSQIYDSVEKLFA